MTTLGKQLTALFSLVLLPFLISSVSNYEDVEALDKEKPYAFFVSPEGISFVSYSKNWNKNKLKELHTELLKNTHSEELNKLNKIIVYHESDENYSGDYYEFKKEISIYDGKERKEIKDVRETLSHEYGHHVQYTYFPNLGYNRHSTWLKLRGLKGLPIFTDDQLGSTQYSKHHKWFLCEIFAEDYVALYGAERNEKNIPLSALSVSPFNDEVENQEIPHVATLPKVQTYIAEKTGLPLPKNLTKQGALSVKIKHVTTSSDEDFKLTDHKLFINEQTFPTIRYKYRIHFYEKQKNQTYKNTYDQPYFNVMLDKDTNKHLYAYLDDELLVAFNEENDYHLNGIFVVDIISENKKNNHIETYNQLYMHVTAENYWEIETRMLTEKEKKEIAPKLMDN